MHLRRLHLQRVVVKLGLESESVFKRSQSRRTVDILELNIKLTRTEIMRGVQKLLLVVVLTGVAGKVVNKVTIKHPKAPEGPPAKGEVDEFKAHFSKQGKLHK